VTFGLVHGGAHGAWCWRRVLDELAALGHHGIAMDLPCDDDSAGAEEYAAVVVDALQEVEEPVTLVGHSLGGLTVPLVAEQRPTRRMIFLCAMLPVPGKSFREQQATEDVLFPYSGGVAGLRMRFFNSCTDEAADDAMARLRRQSTTPFEERTPLRHWPEVASSYIVCTEDRACRPAWARQAARERLGVEPIELEGSDHSPFLSRPQELARLLIAISEGGVR
jgi:pimeloyl-ACP methyl ester carboxylesterase